MGCKKALFFYLLPTFPPLRIPPLLAECCSLLITGRRKEGKTCEDEKERGLTEGLGIVGLWTCLIHSYQDVSTLVSC